MWKRTRSRKTQNEPPSLTGQSLTAALPAPTHRGGRPSHKDKEGEKVRKWERPKYEQREENIPRPVLADGRRSDTHLRSCRLHPRRTPSPAPTTDPERTQNRHRLCPAVGLQKSLANMEQTRCHQQLRLGKEFAWMSPVPPAPTLDSPLGALPRPRRSSRAAESCIPWLRGWPCRVPLLGCRGGPPAPGPSSRTFLPPPRSHDEVRPVLS